LSVVLLVRQVRQWLSALCHAVSYQLYQVSSIQPIVQSDNTCLCPDSVQEEHKEKTRLDHTNHCTLSFSLTHTHTHTAMKSMLQFLVSEWNMLSLAMGQSVGFLQRFTALMKAIST